MEQSTPSLKLKLIKIKFKKIFNGCSILILINLIESWINLDSQPQLRHLQNIQKLKKLYTN